MLLAQCTLLFLSAHIIISFDANPLLAIGILWLCGLCGASLGFVISAFAKSEIAATAATPLVLVPFILFGGCIAPYDSMPAPLKVISDLTPTRWGYQALVETEKIEHTERDYERVDFPLNSFSEFSDPKLAPPKTEGRWKRIWKCLGVLAFGNLLFTLVSWLRIRKL